MEGNGIQAFRWQILQRKWNNYARWPKMLMIQKLPFCWCRVHNLIVYWLPRAIEFSVSRMADSVRSKILYVISNSFTFGRKDKKMLKILWSQKCTVIRAQNRETWNFQQNPEFLSKNHWNAFRLACAANSSLRKKKMHLCMMLLARTSTCSSCTVCWHWSVTACAQIGWALLILSWMRQKREYTIACTHAKAERYVYGRSDRLVHARARNPKRPQRLRQLHWACDNADVPLNLLTAASKFSSYILLNSINVKRIWIGNYTRENLTSAVFVFFFYSIFGAPVNVRRFVHVPWIVYGAAI